MSKFEFCEFLIFVTHLVTLSFSVPFDRQNLKILHFYNENLTLKFPKFLTSAKN